MFKKADILLVDDEKEFVEALANGLKGTGYDVTTALDGTEALEVVRKKAPDLILLDLALPALSGYEVLKTLRADVRFEKIPILVITAKTDLHDLTLTVDCGADSTYVKPLKFDTLLTLIQTLLLKKGKDGEVGNDENH